MRGRGCENEKEKEEGRNDWEDEMKRKRKGV